MITEILNGFTFIHANEDQFFAVTCVDMGGETFSLYRFDDSMEDWVFERTFDEYYKVCGHLSNRFSELSVLGSGEMVMKRVKGSDSCVE